MSGEFGDYTRWSIAPSSQSHVQKHHHDQPEGHMESSPAVEARLREKVDELETFFDRIIGCRVVVDQDHRQHRQGNLFRVGLDITLPGKEIAINHKGSKKQAHEDVFVAIRDAFNAARRKT
ncbi:MAG: HPF/RaiA family ribosome-associated protein [Geminicoccaceae bacterium]